MKYTNPIYGVINPEIIQTELMKQYRNEQLKKTFDCARKLDEFLKSIDDVEPEYQQVAFEECCIVIGKYLSEHSSK